MTELTLQCPLREDERIDDLQRGGFRLIQRRGDFCLGTDSVLLADFAAPRKNERAADLGCGNGALSILLCARREDIRVEAIDIREEACELARRNIRMNGLEARMRVLRGDLRDVSGFEDIGGKTLVICNPPYWVAERSVVNGGSEQNTARFEGVTPEDFCRSAARLLKFGGRFCVVFPAVRALELMNAMRAAQLEPKRIRTVHADAGKAPKIILVEAVRGGREGLMWLPPLILKNEDGSPSAEWLRIYDK